MGVERAERLLQYLKDTADEEVLREWMEGLAQGLIDRQKRLDVKATKAEFNRARNARRKALRMERAEKAKTEPVPPPVRIAQVLQFPSLKPQKQPRQRRPPTEKRWCRTCGSASMGDRGYCRPCFSELVTARIAMRKMERGEVAKF